MKTQNGQSILEYILLISIVTMALVYMGTDLKRGFQSVIKVTADQLGSQVKADQDADISHGKGFLDSTESQVSQNSWNAKQYVNGTESLLHGDTTQTWTNSISNLSFTSYETNAQ